MVRTPKYELIQDRLGVPLANQLRIWRTSGWSTLTIAHHIASTTGVRITGETIRQWIMALEEDGEAA